MADDLLEQLKVIDPAVLTGVIRQDQGDPEWTLLDWTVNPLSHEKISPTTGTGSFDYQTQRCGKWITI